jgi:2C-methyl-D-erythritol 2,4-cyclodiphosphate synthase
MESFVATVTKVYTEFDKPINENDFVSTNNEDYIGKNDNRFLGAIEFYKESFINKQNVAYPFDKNNITYPIIGETIIIVEIANSNYWLPYSVSQIPNYREDIKVSQTTKEKDILTPDSSDKNKNYSEVKSTHTTGEKKTESEASKSQYKKNENIKFLKPKEGDTIISGRVGNTIRFSEFFLTEDGKTSSPGIYIRNKQNPSLDNEILGTLVDEDINKDGTSIYLTSNKSKIPFKETIKKQKVAFKDFPSSDKLKGDQFYLNSDRIILSAKASEFIIFGKGNTGVITDGGFTIDADKEIYAHSNKDIILHTNKNIVLNSDASGVVYVGKVGKPGAAGADVQRMVLAGELIQLMNELIDEVCNMVFATPVGPTSAGPHNAMVFKMIKGKLSKIQSSRNFLSK